MPKQKKYSKRKDGRYHTSIPTGQVDENGREIRIDVYGYSLTEFQEKIDTVKAEIANGIFVYDKKTLFRDYKWKWYKTYIENTGLSHNRKICYRNTVKNHTETLDAIPISQVKKSDVQNGYNLLNGHPSLQREYKMAVDQIFRCAVDDGIVFRNPAANITVDHVRKQKKRALTRTEKKAIQSADLTPKEKAFVYMLWYAGLRRQEILALTRKDIDVDLIHINKAVEFIGERAHLKDTKSEASERDIPILEPLEGVLSDFLKSVDTLLLFPNSRGELMSRTQYRRFWEDIKIKINTAAGGRSHNEQTCTIKDGKKRYHYKTVFDIDLTDGLTAHTFRHEFATILYYSGVDLLDAIRIFGHADSKTLTDIYAELRQSESKSAEKLNKYLETYR